MVVEAKRKNVCSAIRYDGHNESVVRAFVEPLGGNFKTGTTVGTWYVYENFEISMMPDSYFRSNFDVLQ